MLTNEEVIQELLKLAKEIAESETEKNKLGLNAEEKAFYDALTKPRAVQDFYSNEILVEMTKELTDMLRQNRTIDWQKKEGARAGMRRLVKRLLKKYKYPPKESENAMEIVLEQCEKWTDNTELEYSVLESDSKIYKMDREYVTQAADPFVRYDEKKINND